LIVGVGLLIANFDKVKAAVMGAVDRFKGLSGTMKTVLSIIFPVIGVIRLVNSALEAMGIIDSDQDKAREENAKKEEKRREQELKQLERMRAARALAFNNEQKAIGQTNSYKKC
jgi:cellulose biosynthesis protein BcsQ